MPEKLLKHSHRRGQHNSFFPYLTDINRCLNAYPNVRILSTTFSTASIVQILCPGVRTKDRAVGDGQVGQVSTRPIWV